MKLICRKKYNTHSCGLISYYKNVHKVLVLLQDLFLFDYFFKERKEILVIYLNLTLQCKVDHFAAPYTRNIHCYALQQIREHLNICHISMLAATKRCDVSILIRDIFIYINEQFSNMFVTLSLQNTI